uniref:Uncharacterized protein n=1 Tax=Schistocephalus solidus TaxID=70667 RepID=A0A0V0J346_SCHSO
MGTFVDVVAHTSGIYLFRQVLSLTFFLPLALVFTLGGEINGQATSFVDAYSLQLRRSLSVAPMRTERSYHGAAVLDSNIVVAGGFDTRGRLATCEAYVVNTNRWIRLPALSEARTSPGIAALANRQLFVIGGYN